MSHQVITNPISISPGTTMFPKECYQMYWLISIWSWIKRNVVVWIDYDQQLIIIIDHELKVFVLIFVDQLYNSFERVKILLQGVFVSLDRIYSNLSVMFWMFLERVGVTETITWLFWFATIYKSKFRAHKISVPVYIPTLTSWTAFNLKIYSCMRLFDTWVVILHNYTRSICI